ncbi:hypothetical protein [Nocardia gipuzkoensis]|uniref:hypothetical protein n=1 Tax=Nocardia gipuzkoensis TaxID=2749991 RepID=UPI0015EEB1C4|nr:hypothetical protein [Nocardia gipuzkoensis]
MFSDPETTTTTEDKKKGGGVTAERAATLFTAAIASAVAAQGMFVFFSEALGMPTPLLVLCFSFIELMVVTSAMRARRSQIDTGSAGVDGVAMWVLTIMSGVLAATHADDVGTLLLRLMAPLIAAWGWERSMALERRQLTGQSGGLNWRWSPQRLLVRWGIADPTDRTNMEVAVEQRLADLARAADAVRIARTAGGRRSERRAMQRLHRAIDKAAADGVVLGENGVRDRLAEHLEGRFSAYTLPDYRPMTDWADHTARMVRPTLDEVDTDRAVRAEFAELTEELDREFAARATAPIAIEDPSPTAAREQSSTGAIARDGVDRDQVAVPSADRSRAIEDAPMAIEDASPIAIDTAPERVEAPIDRAPIARAEQPADRAPIAAHNPAELETDRASIGAREERNAPAEADQPAPEPEIARDHGTVVSLVRDTDLARPIARDTVDRSRAGRASIAREQSVDGALARAVDRAPIARENVAGEGVDRGPFPHELTRAQATQFARAVVERGLSRQPVEVLARIYLARSQGHSKNRISAEIVGLPHSTVGRAIDAVSKVAGPRPVN